MVIGIFRSSLFNSMCVCVCVCVCEVWNYNTVLTELYFVRILINIIFVLEHAIKITILTNSMFYNKTTKLRNHPKDAVIITTKTITNSVIEKCLYTFSTQF
jgi:hypothetical protein